MKPDVKRYYKEEEEGKELPESIKEDRDRTIQNFQQQEEEFARLEKDREQLINQLRELERRGELTKVLEPEEKKEEKISEEVEVSGEEKPKGFLKKLFGRK